ncbi:MAG: hypothetical protein QHH06_10300 [Clostridiales bacterium]|nr:hypothetical protein [Eubacteriales bacterium]MDH7566856.1 hypothetical protein [Clostridiales bacterium]
MAKNFNTNIIIGGKLNPSLQNAFNKASKLAGNTYSKINKLSSLAGKAIGAIGLAAGAGSLAAVAKEGVELASSLTEVQNVVDTTFGKSADQINKWSKTALDSFGLSELQAKQYSSTLGAMLKSSGLTGKAMVDMSEKLAGLAGDLSSFYNISQDEAFQKIQSGISGETEPLRELGINMTVANLQAYALSKGIKTSYDKMDQASQVALRYSYLMDKSKDAQGDFAKTQGSFANQTRLLKTNFQQLSAKIMSGLLPTLSGLAQKANAAITSFTSDPAKMQKIQDVIKGVVDKIGDFFNAAYKVYTFIKDNWPTIKPIIIGIVSAISGLFVIKKIMSFVSGITSAIGFLTSPVGLVVLAIGALITIGYLLYKNWDKISAFIVGIWQNNVVPFFNGIGAWFAGIWNSVTAGFQSAWSGISTWFSGLWDGILGIIKSAANFIIGIFNTYINGINTITGAMGNLIGVNLKIPLIPTFAQGGIANRPSIFGEAGPEIAIPLKPGNRRSLGLLSQAAKILNADSGAGSVQIIYSPQISGVSRAEIEPALQANFEQFKVWFEQLQIEKGALSFG